MDAAEMEMAIITGNRRALARAISQVENNEPVMEEVISRLQSRGGQTWVIGVTGPPGTGKSSLADRLGIAFSRQGRKPAILAIDPSSPFSGGAILGDRVRMTRSAKAGLFIRSMASRGCQGGLAPAVEDVLVLLGAAGYNPVLLETVGAGQSEVTVRTVAHTVLLVTVPGLGDGIQAIKAGMMEIGDVFSVNKADLHGADLAAASIEELTACKVREDGWETPVIKVSAAAGSGIDQLVQALDAHYRFMAAGGHLEKFRLKTITARMENLVCREAVKWLKNLPGNLWEAQVKALEEGRSDPSKAARQLLQQFGLGGYFNDRR